MVEGADNLLAWARVRNQPAWTLRTVGGVKMAAGQADAAESAIGLLESELAVLAPAKYMLEVHPVPSRGGDQSQRFQMAFTIRPEAARPAQVAGLDPDRVEALIEARIKKERTIWEENAKKDAKIAGLDSELKVLRAEIGAGSEFRKVMMEQVIPVALPLLPALGAKILGTAPADPQPQPQPKPRPRPEQRAKPAQGRDGQRPGADDPDFARKVEALERLQEIDPDLVRTLERLGEIAETDPDLYQSITA